MFLIDFNSIKVQLEPVTKRYVESHLRFQFHKGTIRTVRLIDRFFVPRLFQFHKGTIRTSAPIFYVRCGSNFNSIKVQLEHLTHRHMFTAQVFQFHKGTIRTCRAAKLLMSLG